jgi:hypothetical protein
MGQNVAAQGGSNNCPTPTGSTDSKFHPGQVWRYKTRQGEEASTLTILKVETLPKVGTIVHVRVDKIRFRNCSGGPEPDHFQHMPFVRKAIQRAVTDLLKDGDVPEYKEGYDTWLKACGSVFTIAVAEAINATEDTFRSNLGCAPEN